MRVILKHKEEITPHATELTFHPRSPLPFKAGQYIEISAPTSVRDPIGPSRRFSIASAPGSEDFSIIVRIHTHVYPFKRHLMGLPIGSSIECSEARGAFLLPNGDAHEVVFIAGGIGITPFLSMIFWATQIMRPYTMHLLYFNRSAAEEVYGSKLRTLASEKGQFFMTEVYGLLEKSMLGKTVSLHPEALYYIAGPPGMVEIAVSALRSANIADAQIKTEAFIGYAS
jgi:glycine betaine catabolism B